MQNSTQKEISKKKTGKLALNVSSKSTVKENTTVTAQLKLVLADTFVLYMKTYAVHWNYRGNKFFSVHKMTEEQYQQLADSVDEIAERIRALGGEAPISLSGILGAADLNEFEAHSASQDRSIQELAASHELLAKKAQAAAFVCEDEKDLYSHDLLVLRIGAHDKAAWMLRSFATT